MIRTLVIDDEENSLELVCKLLQLYCPNVSVVGHAGSVQAGYQSIVTLQPELVILDVQLQEGTGFDLLKKFDKIDFKLVFVTAHHEFAIDAFRFSALDYIQKPLSPLHLISAVQKAEQSISNDDLNLKLKALLLNAFEPQKNKKRIVLKTQDRIYSVNTNDISHLESDGNYTKVYLNNGKKVMVSRLIKEFEEMLAEHGFLRVHQSHLISLDHLFSFEKTTSTVTMSDGTVIPVSSRKKEYLLQFMNKM